MNIGEGLPLLTVDEESAIDRFEQLCNRRGGFDSNNHRAAPDISIEQFLATLGLKQAPRAELLLELILIEMDYQSCSEQVTSAEEYLRRFPTLAQAVHLAVEVVLADFEWRQRRQGPTLDEYLRRFPELRLELIATIGESRYRSNSRLITSNHTPERIDINTVGHYQVLQQVGSGSFGRVFKARDTQLDRLVAIKIPHPWRVKDSNILMQMLNEARNSAKFSHPNIAAVYEVNVSETERCYLVSQFLDGQNLQQIIAQQSVSCRMACEWILQLALALDYAHDHGVLHLDIKPSNIILGHGNHLWLTDFGLSTNLGINSRDNSSNKRGGTLAYMSPEQASFHSDSVDRRSDVYSLGLVLGELVAGRPMHFGNANSILQQLSLLESPPMDFFPATTPEDFRQIIAKAVHPRPECRYATAADFADDLSCFLEGRPVSARPISTVGRIARWAKRRPQVATALALTLAVSLLAVAGVLWQWNEAIQQRNRSNETASTLFAVLGNVVEIAGNNVLRDPGTGPQMNEVIQVAEQGYQSLLSQSQRLQGAEVHAARALLGLGRVSIQLGDSDKALAFYNQADILVWQAKTLSIGNDDLRDLRVQLFTAQAKAQARSQRTDQALPLFQLALQEIQSSDTAERQRYLGLQAATQWSIAECQRKLNQPEDVLRSCQRSIVLWRELQNCDPAHMLECQIGFAKAEFLQATAHNDLNQIHKSQEKFAKAADRYERLTQVAPMAENFKRDLAACYHSLGRNHQILGDLVKSNQYYQKAMDIRSALVKIHPINQGYLQDLQGTIARLEQLRSIKVHSN